MISIINTDNSIRFTFNESDHYLQNGTIDAPLNSIALVLDDSDMATFKKAVSGDLLFSIPLSELGMSKEQLMQFYKSSMVGGGTGGGAQIKIEVVDKLPDVGQTDTIYLVKRPSGGYDEYIYVNGEWDLIGDTDISLDDYYTKTEADGKFGTLTEQQSLRSDVNDALGKIATLENKTADSHYTSKVNSDINYDAPVITVTNGNKETVENSFPFNSQTDGYFLTSNNITNSFDTTAVIKFVREGSSTPSIFYQDFNDWSNPQVEVATYDASTNSLVFTSNSINGNYDFDYQIWYVGNTVIKERNNSYFNQGARLRFATTWDDGDELRIIGGASYMSSLILDNIHFVYTFDRYSTKYTDTAITDTIQVDYRGSKYHIVPKESIKTVNGQSLIGTGNVTITSDYPKYSGQTSYNASDYYVIRGDYADKIRTSSSWISSNSGNVKTVIDRYKYSTGSTTPTHTGNTLAIINKTQKTVSEFVKFTDSTYDVYEGFPSKDDVIYYGGVSSAFSIADENYGPITDVRETNLIWNGFYSNFGQQYIPVLTECETSGGTFVTKANNTMEPGKYYKLIYNADGQDFGLNELTYGYISMYSDDDIQFNKTYVKNEDNDASNSLYMLGSGNQKLRVLTEKDLSNVPGGTVDAYTKAEADSKFGTLTEQQSLRSDVENALGDIAALGYDKQNKLQGDYVKDVEIGGSYLNFNSMKFDGNNNGSKSVNFKTVGGQPIFGAGDISLPKIWSGTKGEYDKISNKDANTIYLIHD